MTAPPGLSRDQWLAHRAWVIAWFREPAVPGDSSRQVVEHFLGPCPPAVVGKPNDVVDLTSEDLRLAWCTESKYGLRRVHIDLGPGDFYRLPPGWLDRAVAWQKDGKG